MGPDSRRVLVGPHIDIPVASLDLHDPGGVAKRSLSGDAWQSFGAQEESSGPLKDLGSVPNVAELKVSEFYLMYLAYCSQAFLTPP